MYLADLADLLAERMVSVNSPRNQYLESSLVPQLQHALKLELFGGEGGGEEAGGVAEVGGGLAEG